MNSVKMMAFGVLVAMMILLVAASPQRARSDAAEDEILEAQLL